jgi:hypothetical protein
MTIAKRILLFMLLAAAAGLAQTVNCVVAVVNGGIITLLDVEVTAEFGLGQDPAAEPGADPRMAALSALIDRKIVLDLAREVRDVNKDELAAAVAGLRQTLGEAAFAAKLGKFGLSSTDLEPYLQERILYDRALALRFSQSIPVSVTEVERHYRDIYVPEQARLGAAAEPLDRVAGAIESRIRDDRRTQQTAAWVRDLKSRAEIQIKKDCLK